MSAQFKVRALELHSLYAWDFHHVLKMFDYMKRLSFNTLIIHRNDVVENLEYPGEIFGYDSKEHDETLFDVYSQCHRKIYKLTPTRRSSIFNRGAFFRRILEVAQKNNIAVYIENKELYYPDILPELKPELIRDGHVCPTDPYWLEYIRIKFTEFFRDYPQVRGVITSIATSESKISIKNNRCHCSRCKSTTSEEWYRTILNSMYEVLHSLGKEFIIRDFVFDAASQKEIATVMSELPSDVIISLKNTPHDYYPTFPVNPRIGNVGDHRQWIEFDTMGQYYGMGVAVADLMEDYRCRMKDACSKGAEGVIFRTDWESFDGQSVFLTPNLINVYSAGLLSLDVNTCAEEIYGKFAIEEGWVSGKIDKVVSWLKLIFEKTWSVTSKTVFIDGCVFSDSSTMPISMEHGIWLAEEKNSLKDWDASKTHSLSPIKIAVTNTIAQKEQAEKEMEEIISISDEIPSDVDEVKGLWLKDWMHVMKLYLYEFSLCARSIITCRYIKENKENDEDFMNECKSNFAKYLTELHSFESNLESFWKETDYPEHAIYTLLDPQRVSCLLHNLEKEVLK